MVNRPDKKIQNKIGDRTYRNTGLNISCVDHCDCGRGEVTIVVVFPTVDVNEEKMDGWREGGR